MTSSPDQPESVIGTAPIDPSQDPPLWQMFFRDNPYAGFDLFAYPDDASGWNSDHPIFGTLIAALRPQLIIEVGTWKGASAINMVQIARRLGLPAKLICIDTWLGMMESYSWRETHPSFHDDLCHKHGWPQLFYQFLSNVCRQGLQDHIVPLPQTSTAGLRLVHGFGLRPELIYIDGSHHYEEVRCDLRSAWECLAEDGVLFGDDYIAWDGVTQAVNDFCIERDLVLMGGSGKFAIAKSGNIFDLLGSHRLIEPDGSCSGLYLQRLRYGAALSKAGTHNQ